MRRTAMNGFGVSDAYHLTGWGQGPPYPTDLVVRKMRGTILSSQIFVVILLNIHANGHLNFFFLLLSSFLFFFLLLSTFIFFYLLILCPFK